MNEAKMGEKTFVVRSKKMIMGAFTKILAKILVTIRTVKITICGVQNEDIKQRHRITI